MSPQDLAGSGRWIGLVMQVMRLIADLLHGGHPVCFEATGASMSPHIRPGARMTVAPAALSDLRRGDIVLYRRGHRLIAHRVVGILGAPGASARLLLRGDNMRRCDPPVCASDVLGRVIAVEPWYRQFGRRVAETCQAALALVL